jgi:Rab GDP dissociation inhibitor
LKECVLSGLLATKGKKVLHLDRNEYYGGETASLNLTNLWGQFRPGTAPPKEYGHNRDWNVDLIPKFIMANGKLVKMLLHTKVTKYLEWKCVDASYVAQHQKAGMMSKEKMKIAKIPANDSEALKSSLLGLFEKKNIVSFYKYLDAVEVDKKDTWKGKDLDKMTAKELYKKYSLKDTAVDFLGHAVALFTDESY